MKITRLALSLCLVLPVLVAEAEVYRYVDKNGNQVFTDTPPQGAEKIDPGPTMTMPFPKGEAVRSKKEAEAASKRIVGGPYTITLSAPAPDSVYRRGEGEVPVAVSVDPALAEGDQLNVLLDGKRWPGGSIPLDDTLDRGSHIVEARVVNSRGEVQTSTSATFTVQQTSVQSPVRKTKP